MSKPPIQRWDSETSLVLWIAACVSIVSFFFYLRRGELLLYGDAVAHINIARRVCDSRTPGLLQLGTVWLPLPHLLMVPFLLSDWAWQTGIGGSIPSLVAYVLGMVGIFRLVRGVIGFPSHPDAVVRFAAWTAALICAANPNLIYLQTAAMTEPIYLALFVWAVVYFSEFVQEVGRTDDETGKSSSPSLVKCGLCLMAAGLTRYDGWFLAAIACAAALAVVLEAQRRGYPFPVRGLRNLAVLAVAAPAFWLAYNAIVYRNPLEFANGPYSAKAIEQKNLPGTPPHPGTRNLPAAASYFLKSAELNLAASNWGRFWWLLALAGTVLGLVSDRRLWPLLLLWAPLPFYALSIAYGAVPLFVPAWWPFSAYNVRYGLELLPAFAVFSALAVYFLASFVRNAKVKVGVAAAALIFVAGSYASIWHDPVCFREAWINSRARIALESEVGAYLKGLPRDSTLLMYTGDHVGALQQAGIPLRRVINEGNHRSWRQPDPEGLWERALANPEGYADFIIAFEGDPVSLGARTQAMVPLAVIHASGQPQATIYRTNRAAR
jgi:hypothetical protein